MKRYDLFQKFHRDLRALLTNTGRMLQHTDFTIEREALEAIGRVQYVMGVIDSRRRAEDHFILPLLMVYEPGVADAFAQDHQDAILLHEKMQSLITAFAETTHSRELVAVSRSIVAQFDTFTLFTRLHMAREERMVNELLWRYCTDAELQQIAGKMVISTESAYGFSSGRWTAGRLASPKIDQWLTELRLASPRVEFHSLLRTSGGSLHPGCQHLLKEMLATGPVLAN